MNWLLINEVDNTFIVDNIIVADEAFADTRRKENGGPYDFVLLQDDYDPAPGMGWIYDENSDSFTPPAIDYKALVRDGLNNVHYTMSEILSLASNLSSQNLLDAIAEAKADVQNSFTQNEEEVFDSITTWIENGG